MTTNTMQFYTCPVINTREQVRSADDARKVLTLQNQHDTAIFKVGNSQTGASMKIYPSQSILRDILPPRDALWIECDTVDAQLFISEEY